MTDRYATTWRVGRERRAQRLQQLSQAVDESHRNATELTALSRAEAANSMAELRRFTDELVATEQALQSAVAEERDRQRVARIAAAKAYRVAVWTARGRLARASLRRRLPVIVTLLLVAMAAGLWLYLR